MSHHVAHLSPQEIGLLTSLRELYLTDNLYLNADIPTQLWTLTSLQNISLAGCRFTGYGDHSVLWTRIADWYPLQNYTDPSCGTTESQNTQSVSHSAGWAATISGAPANNSHVMNLTQLTLCATVGRRPAAQLAKPGLVVHGLEWDPPRVVLQLDRSHHCRP